MGGQGHMLWVTGLVRGYRLTLFEQTGKNPQIASEREGNNITVKPERLTSDQQQGGSSQRAALPDNHGIFNRNHTLNQ